MHCSITGREQRAVSLSSPFLKPPFLCPRCACGSLPLQYDEEELQSAVGLVRPSSVAFEVVNDFRFYKTGVYESLDCRADPDVSPSHTYHRNSGRDS